MCMYNMAQSCVSSWYVFNPLKAHITQALRPLVRLVHYLHLHTLTPHTHTHTQEFCGCGDLAQKVERYKRRRQYIDEDVVWRYLIQCLKALSNLHEKGIAHRDLKVANTFLAEDGSAKVRISEIRVCIYICAYM